MPFLDLPSVALVRSSVDSFITAFERTFEDYFVALSSRAANGGSIVGEDMIQASAFTSFQSLLKELRGTCDFLSAAADGLEVPTRLVPVVRTVVGWRRRQDAVELEAKERLTFSGELRQRLDEERRRYDPIVNAPWFAAATPAPVPRLSDFFPIGLINSGEVHRLRGWQLKNDEASSGDGVSRMYDEKFGILQAPGLFLSDLATARNDAELRGISLAVAFLDIDDFKSFNSKHNEITVDRCFLPQFMRRLEAHVFRRGYAYRYGGDEYAVLLHNATYREACESIEGLRKSIDELRYEIPGKMTVSCGLVVVDGACYLTEQEILDRAADGKKHAKAKGKNRVSVYPAGRYDAESLASYP